MADGMDSETTVRDGQNKCTESCHRAYQPVQRVLECVGLGVLLPSINCIGRSLLAFRSTLLVLVLWLFVLSVAALHLFKGVLDNRCVYKRPPLSNKSLAGDVISEDSFYKADPFTYCGYGPGSSHCPSGQECKSLPENLPDYGYTNFNSLGWSYMVTLRLSTIDFWEDVYVALYQTKGYLSIWFLFFIICGSAVVYALFFSVTMKKYASRQKTVEKKGFSYWPKNFASLPVMPSSANTSVESNGCCGRCTDYFCVWKCCGCWRVMSNGLHKFIFNPYVEIITAVLLMINIIFLCMDHDELDATIFPIARYCELIFIFVFIIEMIIKILALSPKGYFSVSWHIFEFIMVFISFFELAVESYVGVVAGFRFLRILRLGRYMPTINFLFAGLGRSFKIQFQLLLFYGLFFTFVAWIGKELLGEAYVTYKDRFNNSNIPRWNFVDTIHSFMVIFRILCGEWVETMYDCMLVCGIGSIAFFIIVVMFGKYLLVNVLLTFLVGSMESLRVQNKSKDRTIEEIARAVDQIEDLLRSLAEKCCKLKFSGYSREGEERVVLSSDEVLTGADETNLESVVSVKNGPLPPQNFTVVTSPPDCWPQDTCGSCWPNVGVAPSSWISCRDLCLKVIQNTAFEVAVLIIVIIGCIPIAIHHLYSVQEAVGVLRFLQVISITVPVLFLFEMLIKLFGYGFAHFFKSGWRTIDFIIVLVVFVNMLTFLPPTYMSFKVIQSLQVLRLLRVCTYFTRFQSFRVVLNTLMCSVPGFVNLLLLVTMVWLIYAVMASQRFMGSFNNCVDVEGESVHYTVVQEKYDCIHMNHTWIQHDLNFNNLFESAVSLFQIGTFKGWIDILHNAADSTYFHGQRFKEYNVYTSLLFFLFISHVSVYTYATLVSLLLGSLNQNCETNCTAGSQGSGIYQRILQYIESKTFHVPEVPTGSFKAFLHHLISGLPFRVAVSNIIIVSVIIMACYHHPISPEALYGLNCAYVVLVVILTWELLARFIAASNPIQFILSPLNILDFLALILALADVSSSGAVSFYVFVPLLLRLPRLAEFLWSLRISRLFLSLRRIRITISRSLPYVVSVYLVILLLIIVYSLIGVNAFHHLDYSKESSSVFNFETFGHAFFIMLQLTTTAGWDGYYTAMRSDKLCDLYNEMHFGSCGSPLFGPLFLMSFITLNLVILSLIPVLIVKFYWEACNEVRLGLAPDDLDEFYTLWMEYDSTGQGYISNGDLPKFLDSLTGALRMAKPNSCKIAVLDIPIYKGQYVYHQEVLAALARHRIIQWGYKIDSQDLEKCVGSPGLELVSSTLWRAHEERCIKTIQAAWRTYKNKKNSKLYRT